MNNSFSAPKKSLGQNFLQDPNIIRKIVATLGIAKGAVNTETVLEIGPGRGALTEPLLPIVKNLHLVEFDRELTDFWQSRTDREKHVTVHGVDILKFDLAEILEKTEGKIKVIGNLPYHISSPVLFHLMRYADQIQTQVVMLQKEVVERMASPPGSKQYGRLSVMLQYRYHIENVFTVPPTAFFPPPKVDSAIARLTPREQPELAVNDIDDFSVLVKQAFSQRRKTIRNTLKTLLSGEQIESLNIDVGCRAETLGVIDFVRLTNLFSEIKK